MSGPARPADKAALFAMIQESYDQFTTLLTSIPEEQTTIPGVSGDWSIKDHLAHLSAWHTYQATRMQALLDGTPPPEPVPGLHTDDEDEINAYFYEQHQDEPLAEVLAEFHASYQHLLAVTEAMSWDALNAPFPWDDNKVPVGGYVLGNTSGHYELHKGWIQRWLALQP